MVIVRNGTVFCVQAQGFSVTFPDTPANRKMGATFFRGMQNTEGEAAAFLSAFIGDYGEFESSGGVWPCRGLSCAWGKFWCGVDAEAEGR